MTFILKKDIHNVLAEVFFNDIINRRSNYYYYIGRTIDWDDVNSPDTPDDTDSYEYDTRNRIINIKKIQPQDVSYVIKRRNWISGVVYDQYDPNYSESFKSDSGATSLKDATFYVLSAHQGGYYNVYKCLYNDEGAVSTERPSGSDLIPITYADGYVWKYMYTISLSLRNKFLTQDYMPVSKSVLNPYYSNGTINSVVVDSRGSGYTNNAQVTITVSCEFLGGSGNSIANVKPVLNETGQFIDILIVDEGNNIKSANVIINDTYGTGKSYYKQASNVLLTSTGAGYFDNVAANTTIQVITTGPKQPNSNAILALSFLSNEISSIQIVNGGWGYDENVMSNTTINISTSGSIQPTSNATANIFFNTTAVLEPILFDGKLQDILIKDPGIEYSTNNSTKISLIGDGTGAKLTPYVNENGEVESVIIENRGSGYTYLDIDIVGEGAGANAYVDFNIGDINTLRSTVELSAIKGAIYSLKMIDNGNGYSHANVIVLGDGRDFVGNCIIENNTVSKIEVINPGRNFSFANVLISGDGSNASASAILSPKNGHGYNPIKEFFSDTIMLYSTINNEKNHGMFINNDYRQFGLIRNIEKFDSKEIYDESLGSACYLVKLSSKNGLTNDTNLVLSTNSNVSYNVVMISNDDTKVLLTDNNNHPLIENTDIIDLSTNETYHIDSVESEPNINKFSGDLLSIDNRTSTMYTDKQLITLKTVIKL